MPLLIDAKPFLPLLEVVRNKEAAYLTLNEEWERMDNDQQLQCMNEFLPQIEHAERAYLDECERLARHVSEAVWLESGQ
ncbi:TPA: hypothetical protein L4F79_005949 [Pseudomonas aeruginosa]|nr:hypothetical protein [Pseudomonas aeruginosa]HBO1675663.1 hypothetical protein [Pseudomonas aeruginosa]HBO2047115.1 hypothetical protein [Pseudomonas aeruginosa]HBO2059588.1 hypothetical protein [Pseudomonas aeruginosa]HBO2228533.1 hypothetical protein [Pseudomonas aeruginosa]